MAKSKIEWTDATLNPVVGCTKIAAGCKNCYAERMAVRLKAIAENDLRKKSIQAYANVIGDIGLNQGWNGNVVCRESELEQPLHWRKPRMIFVCSMSDLFHEKVLYSFQVKVFQSMEEAEQHTFQVLTKRPKRMLGFMEKAYRNSTEKPYLDNVWLGVSCSTQADADKNIPIALQIPAAVRFVSLEPLLGPIDLDNMCRCPAGPPAKGEIVGSALREGPNGKLDWVIVGAESGPKRRECKLEWVRSIVNQCKDAGVPVFVKQLHINGKVSKKPEEWPKDLRIREYPK